MAQYKLTQGDTVPITFSRFIDTSEKLVPAGVVASVTFSLRQAGAGTSKVLKAPCSMLAAGDDPLACSWNPNPSDLDTPGQYHGQITVTYTSGKTVSYPSDPEDFSILVRDSIAD